MPFVKASWYDNAGDPASGYQLFVYSAGTSTKVITYSDSDLLVPNTNPVILDSAGRSNVYLTDGSYKFVMTTASDTDPPTSPLWSQDNVPSVSGFSSNLDIPGTAGEDLAANELAYLSDGSGSLTAGRWYLADSDLVYASNGAYILGFVVGPVSAGGAVTIRKAGRMTGFFALTPGAIYFASATPGEITSTAPTNAVIVGKSDTSTSLVLGPGFGAAGSSTTQGYILDTAQTIGGQKTFTTQPLVNIGAATTSPATVGGVIVTDVTAHTITAGTTDGVMTDTEIPANMLNANGKALVLRFGSSTASTGANAKIVEVDIGGTQVQVRSFGATADASWWGDVLIMRITSSIVDVSSVVSGVTTGEEALVTRVTGLDFTASIDLRTLATTGATTTVTQTFLSIEAVG